MGHSDCYVEKKLNSGKGKAWTCQEIIAINQMTNNNCLDKTGSRGSG